MKSIGLRCFRGVDLFGVQHFVGLGVQGREFKIWLLGSGLDCAAVWGCDGGVITPARTYKSILMGVL